MIPRSLVLAAVLPLSLVACKASINGTIDDRPIPAPDAIARTSNLLVGRSLTVVIGGGSGQLCKDLDKGIGYDNSGLLTLTIVGTSEVVKGSYEVGIGSHLVGAGVKFLDASCGLALSKSADNGVITISRIDATGAAGEFNLLFGSDRITGSFNAELCGVDALDLSECL